MAAGIAKFKFWLDRGMIKRFFFASTIDQAKEYTDDPVLPRYRIYKRLDDGAQPQAQDYYRAHLVEI